MSLVLGIIHSHHVLVSEHLKRSWNQLLFRWILQAVFNFGVTAVSYVDSVGYSSTQFVFHNIRLLLHRVS